MQTAENTPYNQTVLDQLAEFDYDSFMLGNRLNQDIFKQVAVYLKYGRITDVFKHSYANFLDIKEILTEIKGQISMIQLPGLPVMWKLNERCLETSYFGSSVARVFHEVL